MLTWVVVSIAVLLVAVAAIVWAWPKIRGYFKDSETIFLARLTSLVGFIATVAAGMDWSPFVSLAQDGGFDAKQAMWLGVFLIAQGVAFELARRARDPDMK